jgi:hypothetical protein
VSWLTWVRLALIPAGGDWRDLPDRVSMPNTRRVADPRPTKGFNGTYGVIPMSDPAGTVTGEAASSTGAFSIADPRLGCEPRNGAYGIVPWDRPSGAVTAAGQHDNDEASVADPRIPADWRKPPSDPPPVIVALDGTWHRPMTTL